MSEKRPKQQLKITCPWCQRHLDVTELEPLSHFACPTCGGDVVVPQWWREFLFEECVLAAEESGVSQYRALDTELDREVLVSQVRRPGMGGSEECERYLTVIRRLAAEAEPSLCAVYSCGSFEEGVYSVTQYVPKALERQDWATVRGWLPPVLSSLSKLSGLSLWHGALCRDSFRVSEHGAVTVSGFGLGLSLPDWGTSGAYASPERLCGKAACLADDIYSLGCVLWECLGGTLPASGELPGKVPSPVVRTLRQMMSAQVSLRPSSYDEVCAGLLTEASSSAASSGKRVLARHGGGSSRAVPVVPVQGGGHGGLALALVAVLACGCGVCGWLWWQRQQAPRPAAPAPVAASVAVAADATSQEEELEPEAAPAPVAPVSAKDSWEPLTAEQRKARPRPKDVRLSRSRKVSEFVAQLPEAQRKGVQWQVQHISEMPEMVAAFTAKNRYDRGERTVLELRNGKRLRAAVTMSHPEKGLHLKALREGDQVPEYVKVDSLSWRTIRDMTDFLAEYSVSRLDSAHPDYAKMKREAVRHFIRLTLLCDWYGDEEGMRRYAARCLELAPDTERLLRKLGLNVK